MLTLTDHDTDHALSTEFAPAERARKDVIAQQHAAFNDIALLKAIIDAAPAMLVVVNAYRQIIFANAAFYTMLQTSSEHVLGRRPGEVMHCIHANQTEGGCGTHVACRVCGAVLAVLESFKGAPATKDARIRLIDGSALDLRITSIPVQVNGDQYAMVAIQDISDEKRRQALEGVFFHDVLNITGVLLGYIELLKTADSLSEVQEITAILSDAAQRMVNEIRSQRDLSAAERGVLETRPSILSSRRLLDRVTGFYTGHETAAGRALVIADDACDVALMADPVLLERVIGNMVKNALEASAAGQTVTVSCTSSDDTVTFSVHNEGMMPPEVKLQVFQRSFSTKGSGRGLGTYSMKLLTEQYLGGTVQFTSSRHAGTTFSVTIPLDEPLS